MKGKNYRTQQEFINSELYRIGLISDRGKRVGQYYSLRDKLNAEARQWGGHYQGVGKACKEGCMKICQLVESV